MSVANDNRSKVRDYCVKYVLTQEQLKDFQNIFLGEIKKGLGKATHDNADVKCHITYVTDLPDGSERGKYLALDLGGTNFRVLLVDLIDGKQIEMKSKIYAVPSNLMSAPGDKLFDHIVFCIDDFVNMHDLVEYILPMGFTFSFPVNQIGLQTGLLMRWTKGFNCPGVVDKNVVELLNEALKRKGNLKINTVAILNDTTGTLMSCALDHHDCGIGLIVGTGCNGCYLENVNEVENWDKTKSKATHVIINCEFGALGENGCIESMRTPEDKIIDSRSLNVGQQFFEKMVAGMYMGEMVRLILLKFVEERIMFSGNKSDLLEQIDSFKSSYISEIESDPPQIYTNCRLVLKELRLDKNATDDDCENLVYICQCISRRSAYLVSAAVASLLNKMKKPSCTIGVDGSVYRLHPFYHKLMVAKIAQLVDPNIAFNIVLSDDGSGKGAAIIAAIAARQLR